MDGSTRNVEPNLEEEGEQVSDFLVMRPPPMAFLPYFFLSRCGQADLKKKFNISNQRQDYMEL